MEYWELNGLTKTLRFSQQKHLSRDVLRKWNSENMPQIYRGISMPMLCNFTEITLQHGCSPVNLLHIFRTPFLKNTYWGRFNPSYVWLVSFIQDVNGGFLKWKTEPSGPSVLIFNVRMLCNQPILKHLYLNHSMLIKGFRYLSEGFWTRTDFLREVRW